MTVDTTKIQRRTLRFETYADIRKEVENLASNKFRTLGNWSAGQIFMHLALVMNKSIDGFQSSAPWWVRLGVRLFFKNRFLKKPMPAGFKLPPKTADEIVPGPTDDQAGLQAIRQALERQERETSRVPSPFMGPLTLDEWQMMACRHAELHLSFLVPEASS